MRRNLDSLVPRPDPFTDPARSFMDFLLSLSHLNIRQRLQNPGFATPDAAVPEIFELVLHLMQLLLLELFLKLSTKV